MSTSSELRVFISSTFRDLQEEREHLAKKIFPEIRALCRERGVTFTDIDLRWGLTDEQSALGTIIRTCLEEIDRCRPYFIGIVGSRYGWAPEYHEVAMDPDLFARYPWIEEAAFDEASITEMEFMHGTREPSDSGVQSAFFYRRETEDSYEEDADKLKRLVDRAASHGYPIREFTTIDSLGECVLADLREIIDRVWPVEHQPTPLDRTRRSHAAFAASRRRAYIGQPAHLKTFDAWWTSGTTPLVITADSGLGKSSLVAWLTGRFRERNPDALVVEHYVGAGLASGTSAAIMRHCMEEINEFFSIDDEIPTNAGQLERAFANALYRADTLAAQREREVLIVLDALNQLDETGRTLAWLPTAMPPRVHLIASTTPGPAHDALARRDWQSLELKPLDDPRMRSSIVVRYLADFHKSISAAQLERISADPKASSPLFLRIVAEELRLHGEHETLDEVIEGCCDAVDLDDTFQRVLERLERDFPSSPLSKLLTVLWASRDGLNETDLLEIIGSNRLDLSRILLALDYHLLRRDGNLDFFHDYLRRAVERRYLNDPESRRAAHALIIDHLAARLQPVLVDQSIVGRVFAMAKGERERGISEFTMMRELAYQYNQTDQREQLAQLLSSVPVMLMTILGSARDEFYTYWRSLGDDFPVEEACRSGIEVFRRSNPDSHWLPDVMMTVANIVMTSGRLAAVESLIREAHAMLAKRDDPAGRMRSSQSLATILIDRGSFDEALSLLSEMRTLAETINDKAALSSTLEKMSSVHLKRADLELAIEYGTEALALVRQHGTVRDVAAQLHCLANAYGGVNDTDTALELYNEALKINESIGNRQWMTYNIMSIAMIDQRRGDLELAAPKMVQAMKILDSLGDRVPYGIATGNLGTLYVEMNRVEEALECLDRAMEIHRDCEFHHGMTFWTYQKAETLRTIALSDDPLPSFLASHVTAMDRTAILRQALELATECVDICARLGQPYQNASELQDLLVSDLSEK